MFEQTDAGQRTADGSMSFLLNYLDGALDTVTGRYDEDEGEETQSEEILSDDDADADDGGKAKGVWCFSLGRFLCVDSMFLRAHTGSRGTHEPDVA